MTPIERLAIEQAIYNAIGEDLKTGRTGNLRGEVNEVYLDLYQRTGATGFEVRVNGQKVGTYGFNKVRGQKERTVTELRVTDPDALVAWDDDDFDVWCALWVLDHIEQLAREYAQATGELPDGMELVERRHQAERHTARRRAQGGRGDGARAAHLRGGAAGRGRVMLTEQQRAELARYTNDLHAELSAMTVKQLRTYANQHALQGSLGGASTKAALVGEIVGQLRNRRLMEMEGER